MKHLTYLIVAWQLILSSCNNSNTAQKEETEEGRITADGTVQEVGEGTASEGQPGSSNNWQKLVMIQLKDAQGNVAAEAPYPSDWTPAGRPKYNWPAWCKGGRLPAEDVYLYQRP